jgi:general secretion pathway protein J
VSAGGGPALSGLAESAGDEKVGEAGFTLIEVVISLALFALVSIAGLALVDSVIRVEQGTAGRVERLGALQRTMFVIVRDLEQSSAGTLREMEGGVRFERSASTLYEAGRPIGYALRGDSLYRIIGTPGAETAQLLIGGVAGANWSFYFDGMGWQPDMPTDAQNVPLRPAAVAVDILLDESVPPSGALRRVVELPAPTPLAAAQPVGTP